MAKKGELEKQLEKLREKMSKNDYKEKVPVKVQEQDAEKVRKGISLSISWCVRCEFLLRPDFSLFHSCDRAKLNWKKWKKPRKTSGEWFNSSH